VGGAQSADSVGIVPLLEVSDLQTTFRTDDGPVTAVDGVSFTLERGRTLGIVGESGSGKSVTSLSMMRLLPDSAKVSGRVMFDGRDLLKLDDAELRKIRGNDMAMIFQDPMTSLNPVYTIGWQLAEAVRIHQDVSRQKALVRAREMLAAVGIANPEARLKDYPHQFSGGMRQRVMIAMALANDPDLLIADEPTTALDVTTQAQILELMRRLRSEFDSAIVMITHDLGVVAELCDDVLVMYGGRVAEQGPVEEIFSLPQHPYTWGLMQSMPSRHHGSERLSPIPGSPPSLLHPPPGCRFNPRCPYAFAPCRVDPPPALRQVESTAAFHVESCHLDSATKRREAQRILAEGDVMA
jgi:peptide/nickel transport system ATP-binding protein